jgi:O-antigen/teichoic acid export membrane protein
MLRAGAGIIVGHVAVALTGIAALRLFTELAPKEVFGEANLVVSVLAIGVQLFVSPLTATQLRYHTDAERRGEGDTFTGETLAWAFTGALALAVVLGLGAAVWWIATGDGLDPLVTALCALWLLATAVRNVFMGRLHAERRQLAYMGLLAAEAVFCAALTAAALSIAATTGSYLAGQALAVAALVGVIGLAAPWPTWKVARLPSKGSGFLRKALVYGAPLAPVTLLGWLANLADRYVLAFLLGAGAAGQYLAPFAIASRGQALVSTALADLFRPMLFDAENRGDRLGAKRIFRTWLLANLAMSGAALCAIAVLGEFVVQLLLAEDYRAGAVEIMVWIGLAYAIYGSTQTLENRLLSLGNSARLLVPVAMGAAANIVLSVAMIRWNGVVGAAQATCASFAIQGAITAATLYRELRARPDCD